MNAFKAGRIGILLAAILALIAVSLPSAASAKDRNHDRIPDKWEKSHKLSLKKDQRKLDQDRDGLRNRGEYKSGTSPRDKDSDDDGITDKKEKAGIISAYDAEAQTLTVSLYAGGEISGSVNANTEVECEDESATEDDSATVESSDRHGDRPGGSDDDESDDDQSEDESGDDDGTEDHGSDDEAEHEGQGHGDRGDCNGNCSLEDLASGVEITEANVKYTADGPVFTELEIVKVPAAA
ncbi:MAG: hypothetical protein ACSLFI_10470 [Solirubrobacterales bacterium]